MSNFGARVTASMLAAGLNVPAVAKKMGVTQQVVRRWKKDKEMHLSGVHLVELSRVLNVRVHWLGTGEGPVARFNSSEYTERDAMEAYRSMSPSGRRIWRDVAGIILKYFED